MPIKGAYYVGHLSNEKKRPSSGWVWGLMCYGVVVAISLCVLVIWALGESRPPVWQDVVRAVVDCWNEPLSYCRDREFIKIERENRGRGLEMQAQRECLDIYRKEHNQAVLTLEQYAKDRGVPVIHGAGRYGTAYDDLKVKWLFHDCLGKMPGNWGIPEAFAIVAAGVVSLPFIVLLMWLFGGLSSWGGGRTSGERVKISTKKSFGSGWIFPKR